MKLALALVFSVIVGAVLFVALFVRFPIITPDVVSRAQAIDQSVSEGGPHWPGTAVQTKEAGETRIQVTRTWLGLTETVGYIHRVGGGWRLGSSPDEGPAEVVQLLTGVVVPMGLVFGLLYKFLPRSGPAP